ncbi:hypothetical protein BD626DRAFT_520392, partial [Schizophyllum amplum]
MVHPLPRSILKQRTCAHNSAISPSPACPGHSHALRRAASGQQTAKCCRYLGLSASSEVNRSLDRMFGLGNRDMIPSAKSQGDPCGAATWWQPGAGRVRLNSEVSFCCLRCAGNAARLCSSQMIYRNPSKFLTFSTTCQGRKRPIAGMGAGAVPVAHIHIDISLPPNKQWLKL